MATFKPKSTSKKAKNVIRGEMRSYYSPHVKGEGKSTLSNMKRDAEAGAYSKGMSDYAKAKNMVDSGCFACYYNDQSKMLSKIYGKKNVDSWTGDKIHGTYSHLIAREYSAMLKENKKTAGK